MPMSCVVCGMTNVNRVYPCHSCLKYNEVHKGPPAGTRACDFTDCHMPITFDLFTPSPLAVIGKVYLMIWCFVCLFPFAIDADPNAQDEDGETPLTLAFRCDEREVAAVLLKHGE